ncbi:transposase [Flavobacteriaceae bacterium Ap0902]|nr:transposase [Flavobacteriaceae bacterium Ap0902]
MYIGIDISKETLDFCFKEGSQKKFLHIANKPSEIKETFKYYKDKELIVCMENTGKYNYHLYQVLKHLPFKTYVSNPQQIKYSMGFVRGKNDKIDAERICNYIIKNHEKERPWVPA